MSHDQNSPLVPDDVRDGDDRGFALITSIMVAAIVAALVVAATVLGANHVIINNFYQRESQLESSADAGLEWARAYLNAGLGSYPDEGYVTLEDGVAVTDGAGNTIPGVHRWIYAGPSGLTSGQYGVFGTILSVVEDDGGGRVIRRSQIFQESFSKYAYFTDIEPSNISFGGGDQIFGPVHSNSPIKIYSSGATFHGPVRTAQNVPTPQYGTFMQGYQEYVSEIPMPATAELTKLQTQAALGSTAFSGDTNGSEGSATTRIEFIAIDLNSDGDTSDDNEGFIRVYQSADPDWVTAVMNETTSCTGSGRRRTCTTTGGILDSQQCGAYYSGTFVTTANHPYSGVNADDAMRAAGRRCYLGGHDSIQGGFVANDGKGAWLAYPNAVAAVVTATGRADAGYLFPISRALNPNFKGVIYVDGRVVVSGKIRGRVTVAASEDIIFGDDITYVTDPAAGTCVDIAGYFAGDDVIVADNALNAPQYVVNNYYTQDNSSDEFFHGTVLALDIFTVQNYNSGSDNDEDCESGNNGRGCLYLTGGIIQSTRGAVGLTSGEGYVKRYAYDACGATNPPPYFPTTGVFVKGHYYRVDPAGFDIDDYFALITP